MPRDLGDVLHYFIPEVETVLTPGVARAWTLPLREDDLVRAGLLWNLAVELARQGLRVSLVAPARVGAAAAWPTEPRGPLGIEWVRVESGEPAELASAAQSAGARHAGDPAAAVVTALPASWLRKAADLGALLDSLLVLARPDPEERLESYALLKRAAHHAPHGRLGVCVFGARSLAEARRAFERLADTSERHLGRPLASYGVLVDDVHLSRSIVTGRPIALTQPASLAARALADVAGLLLAEEPERDVG